MGKKEKGGRKTTMLELRFGSWKGGGGRYEGFNDIQTKNGSKRELRSHN